MRNLQEHVFAISSTRMYQYAGMSEENEYTDHAGGPDLGCAQDVFVMDTSLAEPIKINAFHRIVAAEQCLAGDDFVIDDPASHDDVSAFTEHDPAEQRGDIAADLDDEHEDSIQLQIRSPSSEGHSASAHKITGFQTFVHLCKTFIGAGVLGLPYAYARGGMLAAMIGMVVVSAMSTVCVFLLLDCKRFLPGHVRTFGEVGSGALGRMGHILVDLTVVLSQLGFSCAYLIFISQNLLPYLRPALPSEAAIVWALVPLLVVLSWIRTLDTLAPFSGVALALIFSGLLAVTWYAAPKLGAGTTESFVPLTLPICIGMAIYAFEGVGNALPIQNQMLHPENFKLVWSCSMFVITLTYVGFGSFCYACYGDGVPAIITMVLPDDRTSMLVKWALSLALVCTYPIAMFPVFETLEDSWAPFFFGDAQSGSGDRDASAESRYALSEGLLSEGSSSEGAVEGIWRKHALLPPASAWLLRPSPGRQKAPSAEAALWRRRAARGVLVVITASAATAIPDFSVVLAFVGAVPSNLMSFFLPALFHLVICWRVMGFWGRLFDMLLLVLAIFALALCSVDYINRLVNNKPQ